MITTTVFEVTDEFYTKDHWGQTFRWRVATDGSVQRVWDESDSRSAGQWRQYVVPYGAGVMPGE